jgi:hypothetical protein
MRSCGRTVLCAMGACLVFALVASSALATENLPHYGKCAKKAGGKYKNSGCTKLAKSAEEEKFEWTTLGATTVKFESKKQEASGPVVLGSATGSEISCTEEEQTKHGEYGPGDQVKDVIYEFKNCEMSGFKCKSSGANEGEIDTFKLHGEPGIVQKVAKEEKNVDGYDLTAEEGTDVAAFACGPISVKVTGGVVVAYKSEGKLKTNKMLNKLLVEFIDEKPGKQVPEKWIPNGGGISHSEHTEVTEHLFGDIGKGPEAFILSLKTVQVNNPKTTKLELRQCETTISCPN